MLAWIIVGSLVILLVALLLLRVGCRLCYDAAGLVLWLKVGGISLRLIPAKRKQRAKRQKEKKQPPENAPEQPDRKKPLRKLGELTWLLELLNPALEALGSLGRKLRVDHLRLEYAIGGKTDPAAAAIRYGVVSAGGGTLLPALDEALYVKEWSVDLKVDFEVDGSRVALDAQATYRIGQLLAIALRLGCRALAIYWKHKKTANDEEELKHGRKASNR